MINFKQWLGEQNTSDDFPRSSSLSKPELAAIKRYIGQGYMYTIKNSRKLLDSIISKAPPTKTTTIVYRGIRTSPKMDMNGLYINDTLVSTSTSMNVAKGFASKTGHVVKITIPPKSRVLNLSEYGEDEILIKSQSRLKYNKHSTTTDDLTVWEATLVFDGA